MILQQPLERGPQGRAQRDPRAASGASGGLDARCVLGGPWVGPAQGPRSFGWASEQVCRMTRGGAYRQGLGIS